MYEDQSIEDLKALREAKRLEALELIAEKDGIKPSAENIAAAKALQTERVEIKTAIDKAVQAEAEAEADLADLNDGLEEEPEVEAPEDDETPADEVPDEVPADEVPDEQPADEIPAEVVETPAVPVAAASRTKQIARKSTRPAAPAEQTKPRLSIVASANVPEINQGSQLEGVRGISTALQNRLDAFTAPNGDGKREDLQKFGIAKIKMSYDDKLTVREGGPSAQSVLEYATDVRRLADDNTLAGGTKALVAAGWCAPSETLYDLCEGETLDGIVSVPEINVARGGINYTSGPQFADFYGASGPGFVQTEAQAIAGTAKTCVTVSCPPFGEVRLDAVGLCIKTPILTESAYPELTDRFTRGSLVAFEHQMNALVIAKMEALSNANRTITGLGAVVRDSLEGLELLANEKREKYRLGLNEALEVVVPFWVKDAYKSDLRSRWGQLGPVSDEQINAYFAASNLNVQWAYDWQPLGQTADVYPTSYRVLMYKAGTFVKGTTDVINLSAVYDAASLATNVYTGLFMERGLLIAKMCWDADRITLPICTAGRVGAADLTCV